MNNTSLETPQAIAVLGGGSFGTAIANIAASNGHRVKLWMRSEKQADDILKNRENSRYLPGYHLHDNLTPELDLTEAVQDADFVFVAVPSKAFRAVVEQAVPLLQPHAALISLTKGIEPVSFKLMSQILHEQAPNHDIGVISGPNLAKEIADHHISATVVASYSQPLRQKVQQMLSNQTFRVYGNPDIYGVELAGALKNIYAIVSGLAAALGMAENTRAALITRALAEMSRFAVRLGANPMTFLGLAGVGDLIVTCSSKLSRNYRVGYYIGEGDSLKQAIKRVGETAEGINTLRMVHDKAAEMQIYMPLVSGLYAIIFEDKPIRDVAGNLMSGDLAQDVEFMGAGI
ncbi:NAD(P)H-dependent glycerol-3-phosphate dehydrogenase [Saccharospirillum salsuginis]|uniref:Glycerol-3-phosphate dehydrogenase [NAD(P)+] n=1 Tax=Saccharospirillum salsuginis TaxID=418750 RepID=A0A918N973_9GAMM|nr:NAD(P)H-dependent glycerol-3-phosphate dehydrogenase [Saccharospirillum salsuginis]GGX50927.1 glycerol-3-phosphate dehydrogenase [NAD(P)+] [Saccharospirillum salsuginis]